MLADRSQFFKDLSVPFYGANRPGTTAIPTSKIIKGATLKVYPGQPHGMCFTNKTQINNDLLAFLKT